MSDAAHRFMLSASGQVDTIAGTIRLTASEIVAAHQLPKLLTKLHEEEPELQIELVASDDTGNLLQREADIALRMFRPTQSDVITRKLGELHIGFYASHSYLKTHTAPETLEDFRQHTLLGYDNSQLLIDGFKKAGLTLQRESFALRCDNQLANWSLCKAGFGISVMQTSIGNAAPEVAPLIGGQTVATLPVWLTAHAELRTNARIRRVYDFLAEHFRWMRNRCVDVMTT